METTENPTTEATNASKTKYESIDDKIAKMKIAFDNASLPGIVEIMLTVGYTPEKIESLKTRLAQLETLQQVRTKEYADQLAETDKLEIKRAAIDMLFVTHRKLVKILFKGDIQAITALQVDALKPVSFAGWMQMALNFYQQLSSVATFKTKVAGVGITDAVINNQLQELAALQTLKNSQRKETAESQAATDARDKAFDELYPLYSEYIQYAKVLLPDNQALEAIGVKVKAK